MHILECKMRGYIKRKKERKEEGKARNKVIQKGREILLSVEDSRRPPAGRKKPSSCVCGMDVLAWLEVVNISPVASGLHHQNYSLKIPHWLHVSFLYTCSKAAMSSPPVIKRSHTHFLSPCSWEFDGTQWSQTTASEKKTQSSYVKRLSAHCSLRKKKNTSVCVCVRHWSSDTTWTPSRRSV